MTQVNDNLVLVCGESASGKSASFHDMDDPEGVIYLNCESGKKLPFKSGFKELIITDPLVVFDAFDQAEGMADVHTIVVDSATFLMDMYESCHVITSSNTMKAWGEYQRFFRDLMLHYVAKSSKNIIFTAHVLSTLNETDMVMETKVPIKGALKNNGIEAFFSTIVMARKVDIAKLKDQKSAMLNITPQEEALGFKYVYQTQLTKETVNCRIRASMGMWTVQETFIDNNAQMLLNKLHEYYT